MSEYQVILEHDKGTASFKLWAQDEQTAVITVLAVENAPKNSVKSIKKMEQ